MGAFGAFRATAAASCSAGAIGTRCRMSGSCDAVSLRDYPPIAGRRIVRPGGVLRIDGPALLPVGATMVTRAALDRDPLPALPTSPLEIARGHRSPQRTRTPVDRPVGRRGVKIAHSGRGCERGGVMQAEHYNIVSETDCQDGAKRLDEAAARWPLQFGMDSRKPIR